MNEIIILTVMRNSRWTHFIESQRMVEAGKCQIELASEFALVKCLVAKAVYSR